MFIHSANMFYLESVFVKPKAKDKRDIVNFWNDLKLIVPQVTVPGSGFQHLINEYHHKYVR